MTFDRLASLMRDGTITSELHTRGRIVGIEIVEDEPNVVSVHIRKCYAGRDHLSNDYITVAIMVDAPRKGEI
jgi:hypothetical protein